MPARANASLLALLAALLGALALLDTSAAATACGEAVLDDWFDNGRVERLYEPQCYGEATDAIPLDIRDYSDAEEVISRALQAATRGRLGRGGVDTTPHGMPRNERSRADVTNLRGSAIDRAATAAIDPLAASSFPIPLLVLGGLSLALLAAGGVGYVSRRRDNLDDSSQDKL